MPNEVLQKTGATAIRFCVAGSLSPADSGTNWSYGTPTDVALTLSALATGTGARQSAKCDLGATRAAAYRLLGCIDHTGETPSATGRTDYYWAESTSNTQGDANVYGNSGADAAWPNGQVPTGLTLAESLKNIIYIGSLYNSDDDDVFNGPVGILCPTTRYGQLIVVNNTGDAYEADDVEMHQLLVPIVDEIQD